MAENEVEAVIVKYLRNRGWIVDRNYSQGAFNRNGTPLTIGRRGMCDWRATRNRKDPVHYLEVEVKATGKKPSKEQREYIALRTHQGVLATWADSLEMFAAWYDAQVGV